MIETFKNGQAYRHNFEIGRQHLVLIDGESKKNKSELAGFTDTAKRTIMDSKLPDGSHLQSGDLVAV